MKHLQKFEGFGSKTWNENDKFFPGADEWMWNHCIFLGKFTDSSGQNFDLGIHDDGDRYISAAIVDGNEPGDYFSGPLTNRPTRKNDVYDEKYRETLKRAIEAGYIKEGEIINY